MDAFELLFFFSIYLNETRGTQSEWLDPPLVFSNDYFYGAINFYIMQDVVSNAHNLSNLLEFIIADTF